MFLAWLNHFHFHSDILGPLGVAQEESGKNEEGDEPDAQFRVSRQFKTPVAVYSLYLMTYMHLHLHITSLEFTPKLHVLFVGIDETFLLLLKSLYWKKSSIYYKYLL